MEKECVFIVACEFIIEVSKSGGKTMTTFKMDFVGGAVAAQST